MNITFGITLTPAGKTLANLDWSFEEKFRLMPQESFWKVLDYLEKGNCFSINPETLQSLLELETRGFISFN
jgi:hypothetical protein